MSGRTNNKINQKDCPICGGANLCGEVQRKENRRNGIKDPLEPCWCTKVEFPPNSIEAVPVEARGKACICEQCVAKLRLGVEVS